jgi:hypothetical protein
MLAWGAREEHNRRQKVGKLQAPSSRSSIGLLATASVYHFSNGHIPLFLERRVRVLLDIGIRGAHRGLSIKAAWVGCGIRPQLQPAPINPLSPVIPTCTIWFNMLKILFLLQSVFVCLVYSHISYSLTNRNDRPILAAETYCFSCEVRTEFYVLFRSNSVFKGLRRNMHLRMKRWVKWDCGGKWILTLSKIWADWSWILDRDVLKPHFSAHWNFKKR